MSKSSGAAQAQPVLQSPGLARLARLLEVGLGLFFLFAAFLKFRDANAFVPLMHVYVYGTPFDSATLKGIAALVTIFFETALGVGMLVGLHYRFIVLALTIAMLVFFTGVVMLVWPEDCGCLPGIKVGPPATIAKNIVMAVAAVVIMRLLYRGAGRIPADTLFLPKVAITLAAGLGAALYSYPQIFQGSTTPPPPLAEVAPAASTATGTPEPAPVAAPGPYSGIEITSDLTGETYNLGKGEYLVASLSMVCDHCMASVPGLNQLLRPDLPPLVGLGYEPQPGDLDTFLIETQAMFPIYNLGSNFLEFSQFIGQSPPRLAFVIDGHEVTHWDWKDAMPPEDEILSGIQQAREERAGGAS
ncbi:MAG: hypothetical protein GC168_15950 [Candidatus Hydrogenedens sp.]|nr:hypothetical protein [Candidatus Hydrogenedens sp.]